jgi:soluble lytic murein transglycosylase-like protein
MTRIFLPDMLMLAVVGWLATEQVYAQAQPAAASPYRLNVEADAFRLTVPDTPSPASRDARPIPAHLADKPYASLIHNAALEAAIDPALVHAVIFVESGYDHAALSNKGAIGLMQVMPDTGLRYGVKNLALSPKDNLRAGTLYLKDLMQQFNNRLELVLAAYNAGENAVLRYGERIPPYPETRRYVPAVLAKYRELMAEAKPTPTASRFDYLPGTRLDPGSIKPGAQ